MGLTRNASHAFSLQTHDWNHGSPCRRTSGDTGLAHGGSAVRLSLTSPRRKERMHTANTTKSASRVHRFDPCA